MRRHTLGLLAAAGVFPSRALASVAPQRSEIRADLARHFTDEETAGTFVAYNTDDYLIIVSDRHRSDQALLPASTFEIPLALIALEAGVVEDPDKDVFKWDGDKRDVEAWNRDHTLRSAMAEAVVPVYQEIARRIGAEQMRNYVALLDYGNQNTSGAVDQFWLSGGMRIDPVQQIDFIDRLRRGALLLSKRSQDLVRDILPVTRIDGVVVRAKTALLESEDGKPPLGWLVGWAEKGGSAQTAFALSIEIRDPRHVAARMTLAQQCLTDIGAI
jgi:beta-lactamase class D